MSGVIDIREFGAANAITDDTEMIGATIDYAIEHHVPVVTADGTFQLNDTIRIQAIPGPFSTLVLDGGHSGYHWGTPGTIFDARNLPGDKSAFELQGVRNVYLKNFQLTGGNDKQPDQPKADQSEYVNDGFSTDRYAPHSGICLDPDGLPTSSMLRIENVFIRNFVVGVMISPSNQGLNADLVIIEGGSIGEGDIAVAFGQAQSRNCVIKELNLGSCRICVDGNTYGKRQGTPPKMNNIQFGYAWQLFNLNNCFGSGLVCRDSYAEAVRSLGRYGFGPTNNRNTGMISGCDFNLTSEIFSDPPPADMFGSWSQFRFEGSTIALHPDNPLLIGDGDYVYDTCTLPTDPVSQWSNVTKINCYPK